MDVEKCKVKCAHTSYAGLLCLGAWLSFLEQIVCCVKVHGLVSRTADISAIAGYLLLQASCCCRSLLLQLTLLSIIMLLASLLFELLFMLLQAICPTIEVTCCCRGSAVVGVCCCRSLAVAGGLAIGPNVICVLVVWTIVYAVAGFLMLHLSCYCSSPAVAGALLLQVPCCCRRTAVAGGLAIGPNVTCVLIVWTIVYAVAGFLMLHLSYYCSSPAVAGALLLHGLWVVPAVAGISIVVAVTAVVGRYIIHKLVLHFFTFWVHTYVFKNIQSCRTLKKPNYW